MATNGATVTTLTTAQRKQLAGPPLSNSFAPDLRLYRSFTDYGQVSERPDIDLRAMRAMLREDGNPRKLEQVLTLPIRSANWELRGGSARAAALVKANLEPMLGTLIDQCTSAFAYRKAFFETSWKLDGGQVVYDKILLRPAVACEASFRDDSGDPDGFRQQLNPISIAARIKQGLNAPGSELGWVPIPANRSFIFTYGAYREPITGVSDLDVALRCWQNIKKLEFLWCQYLEQQSLPKMFVYGDDPNQAAANAEAVADSAASAIIPVERRGDPTQKTFEILESSGKGATQFQAAILYFSSMQTQSVLASFTDLAQNASMSNAGSNALSADQSEFFLASEQARADEMAEQINCDVIGDLVAYNFGPDEECPTLHFLPIGNKQTDRALKLLEAVVTATKPNVPFQFTAMLLNQTSTALGLDNSDVEAVIVAWGEHMQREMEAAQAAQVAAAAAPLPMAPPSHQQPLPGTTEAQQAAQLAAAIDVATELNLAANEGRDPATALAALLERMATRPTQAHRRRRAVVAPEQLELQLAADEEPAHTGGMVALLPDAETARNLLVDGGDPLDQLHLTLCYLGDDVTGWSQSQRDQVTNRARSAAGRSPIDGEAFAHATFNPAGEEPCAVYLIGGSDAFTELNGELRSLASALQHPGFVAHVTAGFGLDQDALSYTGPVRFDRIGVFFGGERTEIPLVADRTRAVSAY